MNLLQGLNREQEEAVRTTEGPLLVIAGAGSGKTRVLTHRAAWLIQENGVKPWNILAVTFTNKAAGEMKERIAGLVGYESASVWVATFHSTCVRILRRFADRIGRSTDFSIYDSDDSKTLMRGLIRERNLDPKMYKERTYLNEISAAKNELITAMDYAERAAGDYMRSKTSELYLAYEEALERNNALDFDDLIMKTVELFRTDKEVLATYQDKFRYIMVDEYQDTNTAQFELVRLLAASHRNLCVVGDDDQSIYRFRGADITNILNFEHHFPGAKVVKLEQNYRSTQTILDAANAVIQNNSGRKEKRLWTENGEGDKIGCRIFDSAPEEAEFVLSDIREKVNSGEERYGDSAILYRTNAQSRLFEERFVRAGVPYRLIGGVNFYARKEIKDMLAYLKTIESGRDDLSLRRIINVPRRGIGPTTVERVAAYASDQNIPMLDACLEADRIPGVGRGLEKLKAFANTMMVLRTQAREVPSVKELIRAVLDYTGYIEELETEDSEDAEERIENIEELVNKAAAFDENYQEDPERPGGYLTNFLEEVALVAEIDNLNEDEDYVVMMTMHGAKGLEFPRVYLTGMEEGVFPGVMAIMSDDPVQELEEERRLCYVGITRAKKKLTLTAAKSRMVHGETQLHNISRFLKEIPPELLSEKIKASRPEGRDSYSAYPSSTGREAPPRRLSSERPARSFRPEAKKPDHLTYAVGDRVEHSRFGEGTVTSIVDGGRDFEVTVDFDEVGTKKMFAGFAKLEKI